LQSRGLRTDGLLVILDGSKALRKAIRTIFGEAALGQRCQVHKTRNILEYLSDRDRPWAQAILRRAYQATDVKTIWPELRACHRRILSIVEPAAPATAVSTTGVVGATSYNEILDDSAANRYVTRLPAAAR
jgi:hypothetical protein